MEERIYDLLIDIHGGITEIRADITEIRADIADMRSDITQLQSDVAGMKRDITQLQTDVRNLSGTVVRMEHKHGERIAVLFDGYEQHTQQIKGICVQLEKQDWFERDVM